MNRIYHLFRNLPVTKIERVTAIAYTMNMINGVRVDALIAIGTSMRGVGYIAKCFHHKDGKVHKHPVREHWETDLAMPSGLNISVTDGLPPTMAYVQWIHQRFAKRIMAEVNEGFARGGAGIPDKASLRMVGTGSVPPDKVQNYLTQQLMGLDKEESPISPSDMLIANAMWSYYGQELIPYEEDKPLRSSEGGMLAGMFLQSVANK